MNRLPKRIVLSGGEDIYIPWYGLILNPECSESRCVYIGTLLECSYDEGGKGEEKWLGSFFWLSADEKLERLVYKESDEIDRFVAVAMAEIEPAADGDVVMVFGKVEKKLAVEGMEKARFVIDSSTQARKRIALKASSRARRSSI